MSNQHININRGIGEFFDDEGLYSRRPLITRDLAIRIGKKLLAYYPNNVTDVEVFGSVARNGRSNHDLDLIICCNNEDWEDFSLLVDNEFYWRAATQRKMVAEKVFHYLPEIIGVDDLAGCFWLDIFIFPVDWRNRLEEIHKMWEHKDPNFMRNIAGDAVSVFTI